MTTDYLAGHSFGYFVPVGTLDYGNPIAAFSSRSLLRRYRTLQVRQQGWLHEKRQQAGAVQRRLCRRKGEPSPFSILAFQLFHSQPLLKLRAIQ
ncbi:MAG: hypothetical protein JJT75_08325 [Opitutales bacterium]|nr:hypothetical protein [Opitutales bacterium]MCH8541781.1 hypothetical protein [Opitutales bacterium]